MLRARFVPRRALFLYLAARAGRLFCVRFSARQFELQEISGIEIRMESVNLARIIVP